MKPGHDLKRLVTGCALLMLLPPAAGARCMMGGGCMGMMGGHSARHGYYMRHGLPADYAGRTNPLPATSGNIEAGRQLFERNCAACHGAGGRGDGPGAKGLNPPPSDLARAGRRPMMSDAFFYWAIAEGGVAFGTAMPAWKASLKETEIWQLVLYLRTL